MSRQYDDAVVTDEALALVTGGFVLGLAVAAVVGAVASGAVAVVRRVRRAS